MELQRQVLLVTWAILLTLHNFIHPASTCQANTASHQGDSTKAVSFRKWFRHFYGKTLWRNTTSAKRSSVPSLLGVKATCVEMEFVHQYDPNGGVPPPILFGTYKNASLKEEAFYLDIELRGEHMKRGKPKDILRFTFDYADDPKLEGRAVEYKLLSYDNGCSILETSAGQKSCSYWVLYTGNETTVPESCKPKSIGQCDVEVHTTIAPMGCDE